MANTYENWNATDVVINEHLPYRRFIYALKSETKWVLTYEHGGVGSHYHVVFIDVNDFQSLATAVTLLNSKHIDALVWSKEIEEIKERPFKKIINEDEFRLLNGRLLKTDDVF